jgi:hypothetical protein
MTTREAIIFSGVERKEGDDDNSLITQLMTNASTQCMKQVTMTPHTGSRQLENMHKITRRKTTLLMQIRPRLQAKGKHPHPDFTA